MTPPVTDEQRHALEKYRNALFDLALTGAKTYHQRLEKRGIPPERIAAALLGSFYSGAEHYMRLGGAEDFAKALHNAVQTAAREFHFVMTETN